MRARRLVSHITSTTTCHMAICKVLADTVITTGHDPRPPRARPDPAGRAGSSRRRAGKTPPRIPKTDMGRPPRSRTPSIRITCATSGSAGATARVEWRARSVQRQPVARAIEPVGTRARKVAAFAAVFWFGQQSGNQRPVRRHHRRQAHRCSRRRRLCAPRRLRDRWCGCSHTIDCHPPVQITARLP